MPYQSFPLLDYRQGVDQQRKAWIAPAETWDTLLNCHLAHGRLRKRRGYQYLSQLGTKETHAVGALGATNYVGTLTNFPLLPKEASPSTYEVVFTDGTQVVSDDGAGALVGDGSGTIDYATGDFDVTFNVATTGAVTCDYEYLRQTVGAAPNGVLMVDSYVQQSGTETLFAIDRRRIFQYDTSEQRFYDLEAADRWSNATLETFPWAGAYRDALVLVNGVDTCFYYDAGSGTMKEVSTDWVGSKNPGDGGYTRRIETALIVMIYRGRAIFLRTKESGTNYYQRARWTKIDPNFGSYASFRANDWADAPTNDRIVSAAFVRNDLIVFMKGSKGASGSTWKLVPTDDPRQPFYWVQISPTDGSAATKASVEGVDLAATLGPNAIVASDGQTARKVDQQLPTAVTGWNTAALGMSYGIRFEELRQLWFTYAGLNQDYPQNVLAFQWDDECFATYELPFHSLGFWKQQASITWDDLDDFGATLDDVAVSFDAATLQGGYPVLLAGGRDQKVYLASYGYQDDGDYYFMRAKTQRLNPFQDKGQSVRLGYVDIVAQRNALATLVVRFYRDFEETPYKTEGVSLAGSSLSDQVRVRILVNRTAQFHQIEITEFASNAVVVDAVIPWFRPEAPSRAVG